MGTRLDDQGYVTPEYENLVDELWLACPEAPEGSRDDEVGVLRHAVATLKAKKQTTEELLARICEYDHCLACGATVYCAREQGRGKTIYFEPDGTPHQPYECPEYRNPELVDGRPCVCETISRIDVWAPRVSWMSCREDATAYRYTCDHCGRETHVQWKRGGLGS